MSETPSTSESGHTECAEFMRAAANERNPMCGLPGAMLVREYAPIITATEFPPQSYRCPHGVRLYAYPDAERIAALRALNGVN